MIAEESVYKIGTLTRVHALRGELSFSFTDDVWDRVDAPYLVMRVEGILVPFFLEEYRFRSDSVALLKFVDIDSAEQAQEFVGCEVYFPTALTPDEAPDEYQWSYFTGFRVWNGDTELGTIKHVDDSTANVLFTIGKTVQNDSTAEAGASKAEADASKAEDILVPAVEAFIKEIDHAGRTIRMELPDGLLDLNG